MDKQKLAGKSQRTRSTRLRRVTRPKQSGRTSFTGRKFSPPSNPPDINFQPFNHLTLVHAGSSADGIYKYTISDIAAEIRKQLDPTEKCVVKDALIQFHINSIRAWNLTGKTIAFTVYDFTRAANSGNFQLCGFTDTAGANSYACAAFELPDLHKSIVLRNDAIYGKNLVYNITVGGDNAALIYININWKFDGPIKGPISTADAFHQLLSIKKNSASQVKQLTSLNTRVEETNTSIKKLIDAQPGLLSKIINGVTHIGAYVAPLAADTDDGLTSTLAELNATLKELKLTVSESQSCFSELEDYKELVQENNEQQ